VTVFDPVEAQQHITEARAREADDTTFRLTVNPSILFGLLASDLESAVEYIAGLETRHENTVQKLGRELGYEGIRGMDSEVIADEVIVELKRLVAEVARLNGVIEKARARVEGPLSIIVDDPESKHNRDASIIGAAFAVHALLTPVSTEPESEVKL
jgi:hypothetical protein